MWICHFRHRFIQNREQSQHNFWLISYEFCSNKHIIYIERNCLDNDNCSNAVAIQMCVVCASSILLERCRLDCAFNVENGNEHNITLQTICQSDVSRAPFAWKLFDRTIHERIYNLKSKANQSLLLYCHCNQGTLEAVIEENERLYWFCFSFCFGRCFCHLNNFLLSVGNVEWPLSGR